MVLPLLGMLCSGKYICVDFAYIACLYQVKASKSNNNVGIV